MSSYRSLASVTESRRAHALAEAIRSSYGGESPEDLVARAKQFEDYLNGPGEDVPEGP